MSAQTAAPTAQHGRATSRVFPALDTVRAVGALMVLTTHVGFWTGSYSFELWGTFLARLDSGVALFFVLSGFLLSRPFIIRAQAGRPSPQVGGYLWKRGLRILPVYWIVAVLAMVFVTGNAGADASAWLRTLTLTDLYFSDQIPHGITQMWSLATEAAFYLVLPVLMLVWNQVTRGRRSDLGLLLLVVAALAVSVTWILTAPGALGENAPLSQQWLPTFLLWFAVGIALAHIQVHHVEYPDAESGRRLLGWIPEIGRLPGVCLVIAGASLMVASTPLAGPPLLAPPTSFQLVTKTVLYAVVGLFFVLPAVFAPAESIFVRVMSHPVARHLGHISYGIFCVHVLMLHFITHTTGWEPFEGRGLPIFGLTLLSSLLVAEAIYWSVERPLSRLRRVGNATTTASSASGTTINN